MEHSPITVVTLRGDQKVGEVRDAMQDLNGAIGVSVRVNIILITATQGGDVIEQNEYVCAIIIRLRRDPVGVRKGR